MQNNTVYLTDNTPLEVLNLEQSQLRYFSNIHYKLEQASWHSGFSHSNTAPPGFLLHILNINTLVILG